MQTRRHRRIRGLAGLVTAIPIALLVHVVLAPAALAASLTVSPSVASPGSAVAANGSGFVEEETVALCWDRAGCSNLGRADTDENGEFTVLVGIPDSAAQGEHTIFACQRSVGCAQGSLEVLPTQITTTTVSPTTTTLAPATTPPRPTTTTLPPTTTTILTTTSPSTVPGTTTTMPATTVEVTPTRGLDITGSTVPSTGQQAEVDERSSGGPGSSDPEVLSGSVSPEPTPDPELDQTTGIDRADEDVSVAFDDSDDGLLEGPAAMTVTWLGLMLGVVVVVLVADELRRRRSRQ